MRVIPNKVNKTLGVILLAGGLGSASAANPPPDPVQTTPAECVTPTNDHAVEGRRAFVRMNCYSCHGMNAHGSAMGPNLVGKADEVDVVEEGDDHGMPAFRNNLCHNDVANLRAYLQLLGTGTEPSFVNWWEPGPGLPSR